MVRKGTILRRAALRKGSNRSAFRWCGRSGRGREFASGRRLVGICKYAGILSAALQQGNDADAVHAAAEHFYGSAEADPGRPKVYAIGEPKPASLVFVTTNFSLTYFIVSGEIETRAFRPAAVPDCEGMSVLTAGQRQIHGGEGRQVHQGHQARRARHDRELIIPLRISHQRRVGRKPARLENHGRPAGSRDLRAFVANRAK